MSDQYTPPGAFGGSGDSGSSIPPPPPPFAPPGPRPRSGGSLLLGLGIGLGSLAAVLGLLGAATGPLASMPWAVQAAATVAGMLPFALLIVGIVLSAMEKTRRTGAGLLLSFGVVILAAGGLCVALIAGFNTVP